MSIWWTNYLLRKKVDALDPAKKGKSNCKIEIKVESPNTATIVEDEATSAKEEDCNYRIFLSTQRICRLCESPARISLFKKIDSFDVLSAIRAVTNIMVKRDDWYPKFICSHCLAELQAAFAFKKKCQETDMKYRHLAGVEDSFSSANYIRHDFTMLLHKMSLGVKIFKTKNVKEIRSKQLPNETVQKEIVQKQSETPPMLPLQSPSRSPSPIPEVKIPDNIKKPPKRKKQMKGTKKKFKNMSKKDRANKKKFMCIKCDAVFQDEEKYNEHRDQSACKRTQCPQCEKQVLNLRIHTRRMHPRGPVFQCQHCDRAYPIMSELQRHMLVHTSSYDFPCNLCSYRGKRKEYLKLHMRSHGSERYLCSECPATFINQSNFNKHRLVHANKQYQCDKCKKSFRYTKQLQVHDEAQHQKIRHACTTCGQLFKYRSKLLKHELRVHNREKRKLNPPSATTVVRLHTPQHTPEHASTHTPQHACTPPGETVPIETYLNFKKDHPVDATFYKNFEQR